MENIFIVLAIIASVVYKIYTSYKEEMEKAAKRRQPAPTVPNPTPVEQRIPVPAPPPVVSSRPAPAYSAKVPPVLQHKDDIPEEVRNVQRAKLERERKRVKQVEEKPTVAETFHFDLRQAVIQSAILDRPYQ